MISFFWGGEGGIHGGPVRTLGESSMLAQVLPGDGNDGNCALSFFVDLQ